MREPTHRPVRAGADRMVGAMNTSNPNPAPSPQDTLLREVWGRNLAVVEQRVQALERAVAALAQGQMGASEVKDGAMAAQALAGSVGTLLFARAEAAAREVEEMLTEQDAQDAQRASRAPVAFSCRSRRRPARLGRRGGGPLCASAGGGRNPAHRVLGERGDRQRRVHAHVRGDADPSHHERFSYPNTRCPDR